MWAEVLCTYRALLRICAVLRAYSAMCSVVKCECTRDAAHIQFPQIVNMRGIPRTFTVFILHAESEYMWHATRIQVHQKGDIR